ncbi:hypothetical protein QTJ16_005016 [Diplocarpon rosae]|uniref:SprT-like domain-containing protein n=1 Tax=Diplocarpon rosae TaxID=946125 RepID=A0AAD9SZA6_9HELO|nr:hypothetical protein QTJ16_005016 [Diplocarpon rosae]PBP17800.1 hypothetical protein BUE80_DR011516 [Diplocarpon rosae]
MAAFLKRSSSPESSKPSSRRRLHARHEATSRPHRRSQNKQRHSHSCSQPRSSPMQWPAPSLMAILGSSLPPEHANGITMERTPSGNSIMSDTPPYEHESKNHMLTYSDLEAARRVEYTFERLPSHRKHERILRKLIKRDHPLDDGSIDDDALASILNSANSVFFDGVLSGRVQWEWSSQDRYCTELIGTTALRRCTDRDGFETLIVLSRPILRDPRFDRRLLLSAFLHELIHCYLFILCGFQARKERGHTQGFHAIAEIIDTWVGPGYLSLCNTKANLNHFRKDLGVDRGIETFRKHDHQGCNQSSRPESWLEGPELVLPGYF